MNLRVTYKRGNDLEPATVTLPLSKSIEARRLLLSAVYVSSDLSDSSDSSDSEDIAVMRNAVSAYRLREPEIHLGSSGTALRFMTALCAATPGYQVTLHGTEQLKRRPLAPLLDVLRRMDADIICKEKEGYAPILINGRKLFGDLAASSSNPLSSLHSPLSTLYSLLHAESTQYLSALVLTEHLFATPLPPFSPEECSVSAPYLRLSIRMAQEQRSNYKSHSEPDWSAASYFYLAAMLTGRKVRIASPLLPPERSLQGDARCTEIFDSFGVQTRYEKDSTLLLPGQIPAIEEPVTLDMSAIPDLVPAVAVAAAFAGRKMRLEGIAHLRVKESDRLVSLSAPLAAMGFDVAATDSALIINSSTPPLLHSSTPQLIDCHGDHRIAMAFAPCAAALEGGITLLGAECVAKSFPAYYRQLAALSFNTEKTD